MSLDVEAQATARAFAGLGVSPGMATGPVARMSAAAVPPSDEEPADDPAAELERVQAALQQVAADLESRAAATTGPAAEVLTATATMARDQGLVKATERLLVAGRPAGLAVSEAFAGFMAALTAAGGFFAERVTDLRDVRDRTLAVLFGLPMPGVPQPGHPIVLVATDLAPADTATLVPGQVLALITQKGGPTSHTAILAKTLGIPAVVRCPEAETLVDGDVVVVDGSRGLVVQNPGQHLLDDVVARAGARQALSTRTVGPGRTRDGHQVALLCNIGTVADALRAAEHDSEGVGLFRTEFLFLDRQEAPSLDEQIAAYRQVFDAFSSRRVVVRTLDAGADKPLPFVDLGTEPNPALGIRGLRVATQYPHLLAVQLTALAAAAEATQADVRVMAPMVSTEDEARAFTEAVHAHGLRKAGVMIEVPAAALRADRVLGEVDFVSIGTNDLAQYTFAADRMAGALAELLDPWQPGLLDLVGLVGAAAARTSRPAGVCGEAAGDALLACVLVGLGITSLSMAPGVLPEVRLALARHDLPTCQAMAKAAREQRTPALARGVVRSLADPEVLGVL
jgi:phosphotransferase system enzyme I (PtsI)